MIDNKKLKSKYEIIQLRVNDLYWALSHDDHYKAIRLTREIRDVARDLLRDLDDLMEEDGDDERDLDTDNEYDYEDCSAARAVESIVVLLDTIRKTKSRKGGR